jgi:hypothetical protein
LRVLHAVRVLGYADTARIAERAGLPRAAAEELLLDAQAVGQVTWSGFADEGGWSLTEAGKAEGERLLAAELDTVGARAEVEAVLSDFGPLNDLVGAACTRWQLTELGIASPPARLEEVLADLSRAAGGLARLEDRLTTRLARFAGYHARFTAAARRARDDAGWVTATDRDSAHRVWFELHEDLLATLGHAR